MRRPEGVSADTAIFMQFPRGTRPAEVERVARSTVLLAQAGLPVPEIYEVQAEHLWLVQEDLGDLTLAEARAAGQPVAQAYSQAVSLLGHLEGRELSTSPRPPLDARRMATELQQFTSLALGMSEGPGASLKADLETVVQVCSDQPTVLCHRDYHSRNLMLQDGLVRVLDHQDALPGPAGYDRASLAYDPYVDLPDDVRDRIAGHDPDKDPDPDPDQDPDQDKHQGSGLGCVAVQRLAKAIGTFADKGGAWTRYIAPSAKQARRIIARDGLGLPVLDLAFATLAAQKVNSVDTAPSESRPAPRREAVRPAGEASEAS